MPPAPTRLKATGCVQSGRGHVDRIDGAVARLNRQPPRVGRQLVAGLVHKHHQRRALHGQIEPARQPDDVSAAREQWRIA